MKNEWKTMKILLQYSHSKKKWIFCVIFILGAIAFEIALLQQKGEEMVHLNMSPLFLAVSGIMPMEMVLVNDVSDFVKSSGLRKRIQTGMATKCMFMGTMAVYVIDLIMLTIIGKTLAGQPTALLRESLVYGVIVFILGLASVFFYKFFWAALTAMYILGFAGGFAAGFLDVLSEDSPVMIIWNSLSPIFCVVFGFILIIAGCGLNLVMTRAFYKRSLSKSAFGTVMKKMV